MALKISKPREQPHITLLYGVPGIGKTTFCSQANAPVFLMTEDGLVSPHLRNVDRLGDADQPIAQSFDEVLHWLKLIINEEHVYQTLVIDSISAMEPLVHAKVVAGHDAARSIEDIPYGRGYTEASNLWHQFMRGCQAVRNKRHMNVILVGHSIMRPVEAPDAEAYDQFCPQVHKRALPVIMQECDNVLFARRGVTLKRSESRFGAEQRRVVGDEPRRLYCEESGTHVAKNRLDLPAWIDMSWEALKFPTVSNSKKKDLANV